MVAAIEIYNKPGFSYRVESFSILAINAWELLLKAKWINLHDNKKQSLYVKKPRQNRDGTKSKKRYVVKNRAGTPLTHSIDYLAKMLVEEKLLDKRAFSNLQVLIELRDSAIHFYNQSPHFRLRLQEIGAACTKNFASALNDWFSRRLSEFELHLMPLAFNDLPSNFSGLMMNPEEKKFLKYIEGLETRNSDPLEPYAVTVNIDISFTKSKAKEAITAQLAKDNVALTVINTEEDIMQKYPWQYKDLAEKLKRRYSHFKFNQKFWSIKKGLEEDERFAKRRYLDPKNPESGSKTFYNPNIVIEFDKHYSKKQ